MIFAGEWRLTLRLAMPLAVPELGWAAMGMSMRWPRQRAAAIGYDNIRQTADPKTALLDFCQSTYEAGANLAHWDPDVLEYPRIAP